MTALFIILTIFGVIEVGSTLVIFIVLGGNERESPPFQLIGQAVGNEFIHVASSTEP